MLDTPQGGQVLDVGCGYGGLSLLLARFHHDLHITGVDVETSMLESAAQTTAQMDLINVRYAQDDGNKLKFLDEKFDAVLCQTVLTHIKGAAAVIGKMARVLKRGGVFMAVEYTNSGSSHSYNSVEDSKRDEACRQSFSVSLVYTSKEKPPRDTLEAFAKPVRIYEDLSRTTLCGKLWLNSMAVFFQKLYWKTWKRQGILVLSSLVVFGGSNSFSNLILVQ